MNMERPGFCRAFLLLRSVFRATCRPAARFCPNRVRCPAHSRPAG